MPNVNTPIQLMQYIQYCNIAIFLVCQSEYCDIRLGMASWVLEYSSTINNWYHGMAHTMVWHTTWYQMVWAYCNIDDNLCQRYCSITWYGPVYDVYHH